MTTEQEAKALVIEITKIPNNLGGGYSACVPDLGRLAAVGDGETPKEAVEHLFSNYEDDINGLVVLT